MKEVKETTEILPKLISAKELKTYLGCGNTKLYDILKDRTFPSIRIGKKYYIIESEFITWINKQTTKRK